MSSRKLPAPPNRSPSRRGAEVTPLPGARGDVSGWIEATVMPRETVPAHAGGSRSRAAVYHSAVEEGARFRASLLRFLQDNHLLGAVRWMSEPGSLPLVTLHCQPQVLERLKRCPDFEAGSSMPLELQT